MRGHYENISNSSEKNVYIHACMCVLNLYVNLGDCCTSFANSLYIKTFSNKNLEAKNIYIGQKHAILLLKNSRWSLISLSKSQIPFSGRLALQDQLSYPLLAFRLIQSKSQNSFFFHSSIWPLIYLSYIPRTYCSVWPIVRTQAHNKRVWMNDWLSLWRVLLFSSGCLNPTCMLFCVIAGLVPPVMSITCCSNRDHYCLSLGS